MENGPVKRRDFLKLAAAGAVVAGGLRLAKLASASEGNGSSPHKWVMVIDQSKCTGCEYCTKAGKVGEKTVYLSRPCMHCEHAPCVEVCMVKASYHRPDGIVMMDYDRCIGCRYCEIACPYNARAFNWEKFDGPNPAVPEWGQPEVERRPRGVVEKCSFCAHRIDRGLTLGLKPGIDEEATPACVVACPVGARTFGDLNDPESAVSKLLASNSSYRLREDLGTAPRVYYLTAHEEEQA
jgi:Fe-S-cluster-containing dehydrogenase component